MFFDYLALLPAAILFLLCTIFPIFYSIWIAMNKVSVATQATTWVGAMNYVALFNYPLFWNSLIIGLIFAVTTTVTQILAGLGIALLLNQPFRFKRIIRTMVFLAYLTPTIAISIVFKWILSDLYGIINLWLTKLNILSKPIYFLGDVGYALISVILINGWMYSAFVVMVLVARLQAIDPTLYEASKVCGATVWQRFRDITLPSLKSSILLLILLRGIWMFTKFDSIWLITEGGPMFRTTTLPVFSYIKAFQYWDFGEAAAISNIVFFILTIFALFYFKFFKPEKEVEVKR